jgi:hypothetical protein
MYYYLNFLFALQMLNIETILAFLMCCRVYGNKVAELPLVGTRFAHRRQGMCHLLMNNLEKVISVLLALDIAFFLIRSLN